MASLGLRDNRMPTCYEDCVKLIGTRNKKTICNNTYLEYNESLDMFFIVYHSTTIAEFYSNGELYISNGGHYTATTKTRLNLILNPHGIKLQQVNYRWFLMFINDITVVPFTYSELIDLNTGKVIE